MLGEGMLPLAHGSVVVLKPEAWVGKRFPLIGYIELDLTLAELSKGCWLVALYRHDCSHCKDVVPWIGDGPTLSWKVTWHS